MTYQEIKKAFGITDIEIAQMFGYKHVSSFKNSSAKARIEQGLETFFNRVQKKAKRG